MSFRVQIAVFGAGVVAVTLVIFSLLVYGLASSALGTTQDRDLAQRAQRLEAYVSAASAASLAAQTGPGTPLPIDLAESNDTFVELLAANGDTLSSAAAVNGGRLLIPPEMLTAADRQGSLLTTLTPQPSVPVRMYVRPWIRPDLGLHGYIVVGQALRAPQTSLAGVRGFLVLSGALTFIAALIAIWLVAGRALRPLHLVASTAESIRLTGNLGQRLPHSRGWDELNRLTRAFNGMLERLAEAQRRLAGALDAQRRFVADASHELRTPLTTIRSNAGLLLGRPDMAPTDRDAALRDIATESERMSRLVRDLLLLARADSGQHVERRLVDVAALVEQVARQAQQLHPSLKIDVLTRPVQLSADADALKQLLWILLDNAARFTPPGGCIAVQLERDGTNQAVLRVADDGPGIPPADLERIFDRFFQGDLSRSSSGAGLGLAIARWIVEEHGGRIAAHNRQARGAVFVAQLPMTVTLDEPLSKER